MHSQSQANNHTKQRTQISEKQRTLTQILDLCYFSSTYKQTHRYLKFITFGEGFKEQQQQFCIIKLLNYDVNKRNVTTEKTSKQCKLKWINFE